MPTAQQIRYATFVGASETLPNTKRDIIVKYWQKPKQ